MKPSSTALETGVKAESLGPAQQGGGSISIAWTLVAALALAATGFGAAKEFGFFGRTQ